YASFGASDPKPPRPNRLRFESDGPLPVEDLAPASFSLAFLPIGIAVRMNTRSPQMIGVESPSPGTFTFHLIWLVSLQLSGGSARDATPLANGPRHCGQKSLPSDVELAA